MQDRIDQAVEVYSEEGVARAVFVQIPVFGSALDALASGRASTIQRRRFEHFADEIKNRIEALDEEKLDRTFIESDEFMDWFNDAVRQAIRTDQRAKLEAITNCFVNGTLTGESRDPIKDIALRLAGQLTREHLAGLRWHGTWIHGIVGPPGLEGDSGQRAAILIDLRAMGLLESAAEVPENERGLARHGSPDSEYLVPSELGRQVLKFFRQPSSAQ